MSNTETSSNSHLFIVSLGWKACLQSRSAPPPSSLVRIGAQCADVAAEGGEGEGGWRGTPSPTYP